VLRRGSVATSSYLAAHLPVPPPDSQSTPRPSPVRVCAPHSCRETCARRAGLIASLPRGGTSYPRWGRENHPTPPRVHQREGQAHGAPSVPALLVPRPAAARCSREVRPAASIGRSGASPGADPQADAAGVRAAGARPRVGRGRTFYGRNSRCQRRQTSEVDDRSESSSPQVMATIASKPRHRRGHPRVRGSIPRGPTATSYIAPELRKRSYARVVPCGADATLQVSGLALGSCVIRSSAGWRLFVRGQGGSAGQEVVPG